LLFPENIGKCLSIDETSLSRGELYTFVTNKTGCCKTGSLVALIKGTLCKDIVSVLEKLPLKSREMVNEVTLDMAKNMESAVKQVFAKAIVVTDRFHVVKLATEALQHIRTKYRWQELEEENNAIANARKQNMKYKPIELSNGDTPKHLLARCKYALIKKPDEWTSNQKERVSVLFERYPVLKKAYHHVLSFRSIYENTDKDKAREAFNKWIKKTNEIEIKEFNTVAHTVNYNLENILNFFVNRNTNANAESFNAKLKNFRANLRGVVDTKFFLFRISKLFG
jgi:transposase